MRKDKLYFVYHEAKKTGAVIATEALQHAVGGLFSVIEIMPEEAAHFRFLRPLKRLLYYWAKLPYNEKVHISTVMIWEAALISVVKGNYTIIHVHETQNKVSKFIIRAYFQFCIGDSLIFLTKAHMDSFSLFGFRKKSHVLPNILTLPKELKKVQPHILGYIGTVDRNKNILPGLNLIRQFKNLRLNIVGEIRDYEYYKELQDYIVKYNLDSRVNFCGYLSKQRAYSRVGTLISTSKEESFGLVVREALCLRKKVIISNIPAYKELQEQYKSYVYVIDTDNRDLPVFLRATINTSSTDNLISLHSPDHISQKYNEIINQ